MNITGIVCEYNPFHNGHRFHIEEARRITGADAVVCVMSGNFVQRGQPAVLNKWDRTDIALRYGADVVIEIPTVYCLSNASFYAASAIKLLEGLGIVDSICFGAECGELARLQEVADRLNSPGGVYNEAVKKLSRQGMSYPAARATVFRDIYGDSADLLDGPNNVLAIEYLKHISTLKPYVIKRRGAGYNEAVSGSHAFQSSTGIREILRSGGDIADYVPYDTYGYTGKYLLDDSAFCQMIRYRLLSISADEIDNAPGGGEGIGNRLIAAARSARSVDELIMMTKSKRYTYTHISRLLYQILLGNNRELVERDPEYIRILGFNDTGQKVLRDSKRGENNSLPIIENINKIYKIPEQLKLDILASDVYNLASERDVTRCSDYKTSLRIYKK